MNDAIRRAALADAAPARPAPTTPAGLQPAATLRRRRATMLALCAATWGLLGAGAAAVLGAGGWTAVDAALLACILVATPWHILGLWNALAGLWLRHGARDGLAEAAPFATPFAAAGEAPEPLRLRTAVLMTLRNEDPARAFARLRIVKRSIEETGEGKHFSYFILSDTSSPAIAAEEEGAVAAWRAETGRPERIFYRRRATNAGFKAGNLRDFCETLGRGYELMLPLDADSLVTGTTVVRMVRIMQAHPRLGILQGLVVGAPASSAFARIFQFGMRHGMRAYTTGAAWWTGDCGPFWGHNALVRIEPFVAHCRLPVLPGKPPLGGHILSHDQVEAVLMRRAGWEVRVLPEEDGSWEDNPPTMLQFAHRDGRWCQGNMQYWRLLALPGLLPTSRFQLAWAILMFLGLPAVTLALLLLPLKALGGDVAAVPGGVAAGLALVFLAMSQSPKLAGLADVLLTRGGTASYGGAGRLLLGALLEIGFSFLLSSVTTFRLSLFMVCLLLGRSVAWNGQARDVAGLSWGAALRAFWAPSLFGWAVGGALAALSPALLLWSLPWLLGCAIAVPFAVWTASPRLGALLARHRVCAVPEEIAPPAEITRLRAARATAR